MKVPKGKKKKKRRRTVHSKLNESLWYKITFNENKKQPDISQNLEQERLKSYCQEDLKQKLKLC